MCGVGFKSTLQQMLRQTAAVDPGPVQQSRMLMPSISNVRLVLPLAILVTGCYTGTPVPAPGRPPAPVQEYWGTPTAQVDFDRIVRELMALEVEHPAEVARRNADDPMLRRHSARLEASRRELAELPNPATADVVFSERLDGALDLRLRELAVEQRLLLARVKPEDPEARQMTAVIAALEARRTALHAHQETLYARYRAEPTLSAGEWIRISLPSGVGSGARRAQGRFLAMRQDSLLWQPSGSTPRALLLPREATVERVVSRRGHAWEGALLGLVGAAVAGGTKRGSFDDETELRTMVYAPVGAVIGGLIGSMIYTEQWAPVAWYRSATASGPAGIGVGVRRSLPPLDRGR